MYIVIMIDSHGIYRINTWLCKKIQCIHYHILIQTDYAGLYEKHDHNMFLGFTCARKPEMMLHMGYRFNSDRIYVYTTWGYFDCSFFTVPTWVSESI